tara:strand:- start:1206 stop:1382 length:177 start_codon:yes stop_codon:yes gene_type:complete
MSTPGQSNDQIVDLLDSIGFEIKAVRRSDEAALVGYAFANLEWFAKLVSCTCSEVGLI